LPEGLFSIILPLRTIGRAQELYLEKVKIAVIGAGIAGLAAAYRCIENGETDVVVLEAGPQPGGLSRSVGRDGFVYDIGPHQIHTPHDDVVRFLEQVLGPDLLVERKRAGQRFLGRDVQYPLTFNDVLFKMPLGVSLRCFVSYLWQRLPALAARREPANFEEWVVRNFGRRLYDIYFGPYTTKVWGIPPATMTARSAAERIAVPGLFDVLLNIISRRFRRFGKHSDLPHSPYQRVFHYPRRGIGQLAELMAERIVAGGGRILYGQPVTCVRPGAGDVALEYGEGAGLSARQVISTMAIDRLQLMLAGEDGKNPRLELRFRSLVLILLEVARPGVTPCHWIYFPDADCLFQRSTEFANFSPAMAPAGMCGICLEIPCDHGDEIWRLDPGALFARAMDDARRQNFIDPAWVRGYQVVRERFAYPMFDLESEEKLHRIKEYLALFPRLQSIGRQGDFRYINIDDALLAGFAAADRLRSPGRG
jgi:protoporphyrinogen oxidase